MSRIGGIRRAFRLGSARGELSEELAHHFESTVEELLAAGHTRAEAEAEARRRFGDERRWRREIEREDRAVEAQRRWAEGWDSLRWSVRLALRRMRREPGFTAAVVLTFALGIGANAVMFGIVDRLLLRPPAHVTDAKRLVRIAVNQYNQLTNTRATRDGITIYDFEALSRIGQFQGMAGRMVQEVTVGTGEGSRRRTAEAVTGSYFSVLGTRPVLGRFFGPTEDRIGGPEVAVISYRMWQREYGGSRDVLGRQLDLGTGRYTVVGVAPQGFTGVDVGRVDLWVPFLVFGTQTDPVCFRSRDCPTLRSVARLADGARIATAQAEATTVYRRGRADYGDRSVVDPQAEVIMAPLIAGRGPNASQEVRVAVWLAGIALTVLVIACANVANLLLMRAQRQKQDIGIRLALGSSRGRVLGQAVVESVLLASLGGAVALLLARWGGSLLRGLLLPDVEWNGVGVETQVIGATVIMAILAGVATGAIPALQITNPILTETLKSGARTASAPTSRIRSGLTVLQAALSVMLLVAAGVFVFSFHRVKSLDLGLNPDGVLLITPEFDASLPEERKAEFYRRATERLAVLPQIEGISGDVSAPFFSERTINVKIPGGAIEGKYSPILHVVEHDYFRVLGLEVRHGRGFGPADVQGAKRVVVVNETMARAVWPQGSALGKCLIIGYHPNDPNEPPCTEVVGVVENARRRSLIEEEAMQYYLPAEQGLVQWPATALLIRVRGDVAAAIPAIGRELTGLEPGLRHSEIQPLTHILAPQARSWRLGATVLSLFGVLALVVASVGLYSVLAFAVAQRTFELGVRTALGASRGRLMALVFGQAFRLVVVGIVLGLIVAFFAAPKIEPLLFRTSPRDPWVLGMVAVALVVVGALASWLPALRATRVDPSIALRAE